MNNTAPAMQAGSNSIVCDCPLEARLNGIAPSNSRKRGFIEMEVIHFPEYRSVIYACERCGKRFEGFFEGGEYHFIPVLGGP